MNKDQDELPLAGEGIPESVAAKAGTIAKLLPNLTSLGGGLRIPKIQTNSPLCGKLGGDVYKAYPSGASSEQTVDR